VRVTVAGVLFVAVGILSSQPAFASGISYTCNNSGADKVSTSICNSLNGTISGLYAGVLSNASAQIYITFGSTSLGQSQQYYNSVSYNNYYNALVSHSSGDSTDLSALASLSSTEPSIFNGGSIFMPAALEAALGLGTGQGVDLNLDPCTLNPGASHPTCYNGILTVSDSFTYYYRTGGANTGHLYDFFSVVEHETDEILGTFSCLGPVNPPGISSSCYDGAFGEAAADLFRYTSTGRSYTADAKTKTSAYFSTNGGATSLVAYNNSGTGDYGDWSTACQHVQDAVGCSNGTSLDITSNGGAEITVLDALGYNRASSATPEPSTWGLLSLSLIGLGIYRRRLI
jgi:hypothetical protein